MRLVERALAAISSALDRQSLADHPGQVRVSVCLPHTLARFDGPPDNATLDALTAAVAGSGTCEERVETPERDSYLVYGSSVDDLVRLLSPVCIDSLNRPDAYFLCTDPERGWVDHHVPLSPRP